MDAERQRIINEADRIVGEIKQIFLDTEHWNSINPAEESINPDPDGRLATCKAGLESMLKSEGRSAITRLRKKMIAMATQ